MARAFTPIYVANAKHTDKRQEIPDPGCKGLHLVIQPKPSTVKSWAVRYRFGGKAYKLTLGDVAIGLAVARKMTADALAEVAQPKKRTSGPRKPSRTPSARRFALSPKCISRSRARRKAVGKSDTLLSGWFIPRLAICRLPRYAVRTFTRCLIVSWPVNCRGTTSRRR